MKSTGKIISASRRTDIPAFHSQWFMQCLKDGCCPVKNPYNLKSTLIDLRPESVAGIVFWTRNPEPLFPSLDFIKSAYKTAFQFTIIDYPEYLHPNSPPVVISIERFKFLSRNLPLGAVAWRYDPIILNEIFNFEYHVRKFDWISDQLICSTNQCYISFIDMYRKMKRKFESILLQQGGTIVCAELKAQIELALQLAEMAQKKGMHIHGCCEDHLVKEGISKASCIGPEILTRAGITEFSEYPRSSTRPSCGCIASTDIGMYGTCRHGCIYCYAS